jgi:hexosaminidase
VSSPLSEREGATAPRWCALPQPTWTELTDGEWRPRTARVVANDPALEREAVRLRGELAALGIGAGDASTVTLQLARPAAGTGPASRAAEAFEIAVNLDVEIAAAGAAGAFRATRQLLHNLRARGAVPHGVVGSEPAVHERGFHLDAARKYFPATWMVGLLHELADVGINAFQWHLSENEGFRIESAAFPEVVCAEHVTRAQARQVQRAAADLHIDVIVSLDMPGHLRHVLDAHPGYRLSAPPGLDASGALDIARADAVAFAHDLIDDVVDAFPDARHWNLGADEFVDFARLEESAALTQAAAQRWGPRAGAFDLLTSFVNETARHLAARGLAARAWNDGMLRAQQVPLDPDVTLAWWTSWHAGMRPLAAALAAGHDVVNFHDALFYYVLGERAGYRYPSSERIWAAQWHPGLFPDLPGGGRQEIAAPSPPQLVGATFSVWCDDAEAQTPAQVVAGIRAPLRAMAERSWNAGSALSHTEFRALDAAIGTAAST